LGDAEQMTQFYIGNVGIILVIITNGILKLELRKSSLKIAVG
jgi:hypothetical protein